MSRSEERALLSAARAGDRRAISRLLRAVADPALRFGRSFCRQDQDAEEVMQDVLTSLAKGLQSFRGDAALSTWAYQVARHACMRRRRRRQAAFEPLEPGSRPALQVSDPGADPERGYERRELREGIERAIASLPVAQREVLVLRDVEGLKASEVGQVLGLTERAVKSRLHRARVALRQALAPALGKVPEGSAAGERRRCPDTASLWSRYMEGELAKSDCARLARHVEECGDCGSVCEELRAVLAACREHGRQRTAGDLRLRIREATREAERAG